MQLIDFLSVEFDGRGYRNPLLSVQEKVLEYKSCVEKMQDSDFDSVAKAVAHLLAKHYMLIADNSDLSSDITALVLHNTATAELTQAAPKAEALDELYSLWSKLVSAARIESKFERSAHTEFAANVLKDIFAMDFVCSNFIADHLVAHAKNLQGTNDEKITPDVEAVQIDWISNGILARGENTDGHFCNYYRDTSTFTSQYLGGKTFEFVKGKEPVTGDKCVVYFGITDLDSE